MFRSATELRCQFAPSLRGAQPLSDLGQPLVLRFAVGSEQLGHCVRVDNVGVIGQHGDRVNYSQDELLQAFEKAGLSVHGREVRSDGVEVLGVVLGGRRLEIQPSLKRLWRVRQAIVGIVQ
ncbi:unnamed protein product [Prorocentrum cordatum]|uniref:Uncharacterized protein n=1 Tax=Prorocentrum cordatum TaxID=2364126 RepID=A0ABN9WBE9_9DINO|nr:unnamed protein product [Polarella glacialis]